jgi:hypothetical protein
MNYNCNTCAMHDGKAQDCDLNIGENAPYHHCKFDTHPSDMHPCEHGKAIVATAIAAVEFEVGDNFIEARHHGHHPGICDKRTGEWWSQCTAKFCSRCGLLLPTAAELQQMYDRHKEPPDA